MRPNLTTSGSGRVWAWIASFVVSTGLLTVFITSGVLRATLLPLPMLRAAVVIGRARVIVFWKGQAIRKLLRIIKNCF